MNAAARIVETDRRRAILAALSLAPGYSLPERALRAQVEAVGYAVSLHVMQADISWLADLGLLKDGNAPCLTDLGLDVVLGRATVPGVRRPEPGEV